MKFNHLEGYVSVKQQPLASKQEVKHYINDCIYSHCNLRVFSGVKYIYIQVYDAAEAVC